MIRFFRLPSVFRLLYSGSLFRLGNATGKQVCLTFDDGPNPEMTPAILRILRNHGTKATFFCTGQNIERYPEIFNDIIAQGHHVGNHGYMHIKGARTRFQEYVENAERGAVLTGSSYFRPPFGNITFRQFKSLKGRYKIVFWDLIVYDFDKSFPEGAPLRVLKRFVRPGSIIVLHDNSRSCAAEFLDEAIGWLKSSGYIFTTIDSP